ncbi:FmdB family zinc ribbon protein [Halanaerobium praevalens]|uniref:Regulatory protein, FmdB family n=1 Tax=Halanaerobium praevalens (strain ATCC 33744 / DSM 2228 / GSL) TaxID=572479 RepID=E3DPE8_HALPG|nr:FmdB family zinc ribbon protein [Halanaerobium praevalens]ADO77710.1 regulatory protein, FmdB family [Halanaerobium praevalens DSM 2228]
MPTYLYECEKCGRFEEFQNMSEEPLNECPECKSEVKRIIGSPGIIFKGSNFYVNQEQKSAAKSKSKNEKIS